MLAVRAVTETSDIKWGYIKKTNPLKLGSLTDLGEKRGI